jgi:hypothetical protein
VSKDGLQIVETGKAILVPVMRLGYRVKDSMLLNKCFWRPGFGNSLGEGIEKKNS